MAISHGGIQRRPRIAFVSIGFAALAMVLSACGGGGGSVQTMPSTGGSKTLAKRLGVIRPNGITHFVAINAGGGAATGFSGDSGNTGGSTYSTTAPIDTSGVVDPAPQSVYQSERYGNFSYKIGGLSPGVPYMVRLHFAEIYFNSAGSRVFNVTLNSAPILTNFDIFATAHAQNKAIVESYNTLADPTGSIVINFVSITNNAKISGIEVVQQNQLTGAPQAVNAGGPAIAPFSGDDNYNGGTTYATAATIDTSLVANPPPPTVFQTERFGNFSYTFTNLTPGVSYPIRLDFAEIYWHGAGQRIFNVAINGTSELTNFDIFQAAGNVANKAIAENYNVAADSNGKITIVFTTVRDNAKVSAIEIGAAGSSGPPTFSSKIQHVVVIIQENRSFDNLFNGFPGADTVQSGVNSQGATIPLAQVSLEDHHDPAHSHGSFETAYDGGKNDRFDQEGFDFFPISTPNYQYAYVPPSETATYFALASKYALGDRMFTSNSGPSYVSHQYLIAGQSANVSEVPSNPPWGCDAPAGTTTTVLNAQGQEQQGPFPCFDYQTLGDQLDAKSVTWAYYAPTVNASGGIWSAYDAIKHIRYGNDWTNNVISPETTVLSDIQSNKLRQVSFVVPDFANSDHAIAGTNAGPQWVSSIVDAVGASQYWSSTAIIVVWDDWGGWYDHVVPRQLDVNGLGFRVPVIVVSPYAKHGYISHVQHEHASIVKFIEEVYGLSSLGTADVRADDMSDFFDLSQGVTPLVRLRSDVQSKSNIQRFINERPSLRPPDSE